MRWKKTENRNYGEDVREARARAERFKNGEEGRSMRVFWCWRRRWKTRGYHIEQRYWEPSEEWGYIVFGSRRTASALNELRGPQMKRPNFHNTLAEAKAAAEQDKAEAA